MNFGDFSDNNALPLPLAGLDGAMLKLYAGGTWLPRAFAQAKAVFPAERVGFYSPGDATPTWGEQKAAIEALGVDPKDHPWALDFEFGYTVATVKATLAAAKADGMTKRGLYQRSAQELGQTWDWRSISGHNDGNVFPHMILDQWNTVPFDQDRTDLGLTDWKSATVSSYQGEEMLDPVKDAKVFKEMLDKVMETPSEAYWMRFLIGFGDAAQDRPDRRTTIPQPYANGFDFAKSQASGLAPHKHGLSGFPAGTGDVIP